MVVKYSARVVHLKEKLTRKVYTVDRVQKAHPIQK